MTDPTPPIEIPDDNPRPAPDIEPSPAWEPEIQPAEAPPEMPQYDDDAGLMRLLRGFPIPGSASVSLGSPA